MTKKLESEILYNKIEKIRLLTHRQNQNSKGFSLVSKGQKKFGKPIGSKGATFKIPRQVDKEIECIADKCPKCGSKKLKKWFDEVLFNRDLFITKKQLSVKDINYTIHNYICRKCKNEFNNFPKRAVRYGYYGLGIHAYSVFKRIVLSTPINKISSEYKHLFSIDISEPSILEFIRKIAEENQPIYNEITLKIKKSKVIYADETRWPINKIKWWVWIFTSEKYAVYILSEKRDAKVPSEFLKDYKGVLVCDFYSAYEKVKCKQQKCLVHVLRDFQKVLKKAPYDDELTKFIEKFLGIINPILDKLREDNPDYDLIKNQKEKIRKQIKVLLKEEYLSKIVNTFKKRFKKHIESMIRFMSKPDIICWNNNKAERDLRPLCVQRKISGTMRSEKNSIDYLLLFSIYQTCEKRSINFMKFLLSRKKKIPNKPLKRLMK